MKTTIAIICIFIVLISGCICLDIYVYKTTSALKQQLDTVEDSQNRQEDLQSFMDKWDKQNTFLELIIDHEEIDLINNYLWTMNTQLETKQEEEFLVSLELTKKMLEHIIEKNKLAFDNVF